MIVVWSDGEVTLYPGDGKGGFLPERRLQAPNSTWTHAETVTGGDFTGSDLSDLMACGPTVRSLSTRTSALRA